MIGCIYAAIKRQINNLETYIKSFENEATEDDIHDFRVSVKRLRAYRYFLRILNCKNFKIGNNLEMAYLAAGRLRDTTNKSIYLKTIKGAESAIDSDLELLEEAKNVYLLEFNSVLHANGNILQPIEDAFHTGSYSNQEIVISELSLIFNVHIANLKMELNKPNPDIDLHEVRKLFKKLSYLFELINKYNSSKQAQNDKKAAVSVEKKLGIWHDMHVLKLEEKNFQSLTRNNIDKLEIRYGVKNREKLIQFAKRNMKKFRLVPVIVV